MSSEDSNAERAVDRASAWENAYRARKDVGGRGRGFCGDVGDSCDEEGVGGTRGGRISGSKSGGTAPRMMRSPCKRVGLRRQKRQCLVGAAFARNTFEITRETNTHSAGSTTNSSSSVSTVFNRPLCAPLAAPLRRSSTNPLAKSSSRPQQTTVPFLNIHTSFESSFPSLTPCPCPWPS